MARSRDEKLAIFAALVEQTDDVVTKGKATTYTSMNGNMFAFLGKEDVLAFRLSDADRAAFLEAQPDAVVVQYDTVMKHYVGLSDAFLDDAEATAALWARCVANARTLKAQPTKRKKK